MSASPQPLMSFEQANELLATPSLQRARACNAVILGLNKVNVLEQRALPNLLLPFFSAITDERVNFSLYEQNKRLALLSYVFDEGDVGAPRLYQRTLQGETLPASSLTEALQPIFDEMLASLEREVWLHVEFDR